MGPKTTIDYWSALKAVAEEGSFAKASQKLNKTQSTISYSIKMLQQQLGIELIEIKGRKAELTPAGLLLVEDGKAIIEGLLRIEGRAKSLAIGHETKVRIIIESCLPKAPLTPLFVKFSEVYQDTFLEVQFLHIDEIHKRYQNNAADLYLMGQLPERAFGDQVTQLKQIPVTSPHNSLALLGRPITRKDLALDLYIKIGIVHKTENSLPTDKTFISGTTWFFNSFSAAIDCIKAGVGFGWIPEHLITQELAEKSLIPLCLEEGTVRHLAIELVYQNRHAAGPATLFLGERIKQAYHQHNN